MRMSTAPAGVRSDDPRPGFEPAIYAAIVAAGGPSAVAREFGTSRQRVRSWYIGASMLDADEAKKLADMTKGAFTGAQLLRATLRQKARRHLDLAERYLEASKVPADEVA